MSTALTGVPKLKPGYRMQWEEAQQSDVLLYPEGMVNLNGPASAILKVCDGERDVAAVIATLKEQFGGAELDNDVLDFLQEAQANGWISVD